MTMINPGWRPMSEPPSKYTRIIAAAPNHKGVVYVAGTYKGFGDTPWVFDLPDYSLPCLLEQFSHWMPMPELYASDDD